MFPVSDYVTQVLDRLHAAGFEAYLVGGCVRDHIMGVEPKDYDMTTSALPGQTEEVFKGWRIIETGLKHGTVTVLSQGHPIEITTFRVDGEYSDSRHPDSVTFTRSLREDLARRDFTCNAIAYSPETGIIDYFGGCEDIKNRTIRAVGDPRKRFTEDALRILRALRFASTLGFDIESGTAQGMRDCVGGIANVAGERIFAELSKMMCGDNVGSALRGYTDILDSVIPGIARMKGFEQHSPYHIYDVLEHSIKAAENVPAVVHLRFAALLHDIGKPDRFSMDDDGVGHFYGHAARSAEITRGIFERYRCDKATSDAVRTLVEHHDIPLPPDRKMILRRLNRFGEDTVRDLLTIKRADTIAHSRWVYGRLGEIEKARDILDALVAERSCFSLRQLAVSGGDLIAIGYTPGKKLGDTLNMLLEAVMDGKCENEREALLELARNAIGE